MFTLNDIVPAKLAKYSLQLSHCMIINVFLSSMADFAPMNAVYATFFGISPPARVCVAVDLQASLRMKLDCIAYIEGRPTDRQVLHVQGLSYWAPANIGPYSQAASVRLCSAAEFVILNSILITGYWWKRLTIASLYRDKSDLYPVTFVYLIRLRSR